MAIYLNGNRTGIVKLKAYLKIRQLANILFYRHPLTVHFYIFAGISRPDAFLHHMPAH
jgi:hypothetical protein